MNPGASNQKLRSDAAARSARVAQELARDAFDLKANRSSALSETGRQTGEELLASAARAAERVSVLLLREEDHPNHR